MLDALVRQSLGIGVLACAATREGREEGPREGAQQPSGKVGGNSLLHPVQDLVAHVTSDCIPVNCRVILFALRTLSTA